MPRLGVLEHRSQGSAGSASWDPEGTVVWGAAPKRPVSHSAPVGVNRLELPPCPWLPPSCTCLRASHPLGSTYSKVRVLRMVLPVQPLLFF